MYKIVSRDPISIFSKPSDHLDSWSIILWHITNPSETSPITLFQHTNKNFYRIVDEWIKGSVSLGSKTWKNYLSDYKIPILPEKIVPKKCISLLSQSTYFSFSKDGILCKLPLYYETFKTCHMFRFITYTQETTATTSNAFSYQYFYCENKKDDLPFKASERKIQVHLDPVVDPEVQVNVDMIYYHCISFSLPNTEKILQVKKRIQYYTDGGFVEDKDLVITKNAIDTCAKRSYEFMADNTTYTYYNISRTETNQYNVQRQENSEYKNGKLKKTYVRNTFVLNELP